MEIQQLQHQQEYAAPSEGLSIWQPVQAVGLEVAYQGRMEDSVVSSVLCEFTTCTNGMKLLTDDPLRKRGMFELISWP